MSLQNLEDGDKVVGFPYGIGEFVRMGSRCPNTFVIQFPHKDTLCGIRKSYNESGSECGFFDVPSCWPISEAPDWVWGALGIEKPKQTMKKEITKCCVLRKSMEDVVFISAYINDVEKWIENQKTNKDKYIIGKAVITYEMEV